MQAEIDDLAAFCPSFNCYFSDSLTSMAVAKVSRELKLEQAAAQFHEFIDVDEEVFDFSLKFADVEISGREIDLEVPQFAFPIFDTELLTKHDVDLAVEKINHASSVRIQFQKLYGDDVEETSSPEADDLEGRPSGIFCLWRSKANVVSSPLTKCKKMKSISTGSGSRLTWRVWNLLRWSNSEGKESIFFQLSKKFRASKQIRNVDSDEVTKVAGN